MTTDPSALIAADPSNKLIQLLFESLGVVMHMMPAKVMKKRNVMRKIRNGLVL